MRPKQTPAEAASILASAERRSLEPPDGDELTPAELEEQRQQWLADHYDPEN